MSVQDIQTVAQKTFESGGDLKPVVIMMLDVLAVQEDQIQKLQNKMESLDGTINQGVKIPQAPGGSGGGLSIG